MDSPYLNKQLASGPQAKENIFQQHRFLVGVDGVERKAAVGVVVGPGLVDIRVDKVPAEEAGVGDIPALKF